MSAKHLKQLSYLIISIFLTLGLSLSLQSLLAAWTAPASAPPDSNVSPPLNESATDQVKLGGLGLGGNFAVSGNSSFSGNVGIGTTNPNAALHVSGSSVIFGQGEGGQPLDVTIRGPAAVGGNIPGADVTFDASNGTGAGGSGPIIFRTAAPATQSAAIAFDAASSASGKDGSSLDWTHTTSGADRILIVGFSSEWPSCTVSSATYAGKAMTKKATYDYGRAHVEMWYLVAPATGNNTVILSLDFYCNFSSGWAYAAGAHSYTGVNQANPLGTSASGGISRGGTVSATVSSAAGELVVDAVAAEGSLIVGGSQTQRYNNNYGTSIYNAGSSEPGAATVTMSWTSGSGWSSIIAVPLKGLGVGNALTERLRLTPAGNVGIGLNNPTGKLQINAPAGTEGLRIVSANNYSPLNIRNSADTADIFRVDQNGDIKAGKTVYKDASGNVIIQLGN